MQNSLLLSKKNYINKLNFPTFSNVVTLTVGFNELYYVITEKIKIIFKCFKSTAPNLLQNDE